SKVGNALGGVSRQQALDDVSQSAGAVREAPRWGASAVSIDGTIDKVRFDPMMAGGGGEPVRIREWFPETLLWKPELITDDHARATLDVDLAASITTWRLTGSAVSADGRLGAMQTSLRVFQPFFVDLNLPVSLTRNDEVAVPVVVYNYLDKPQTVKLTLQEDKDDAWFTLQGGTEQSLD